MKKKKIIGIVSAILVSLVVTEPLCAPIAVYAATGQAVEEGSTEEISASQEFAYDINGDSLVYTIKSMNNDKTLNFTYDNDCNRLTKSDGKDTTYYSYDENGNLHRRKK